MAPFWSGLTAALRRDESYAQVATDDGVEDGQIQLPGQEKRKRRSCMCCGVDCSFFFKSLGAVSGLWIVYLLLSGGVPQVMQPKSASIEGMPEFGKSLGCEDAKFFYKDSPKGYPISVPVSNDYHDHSIKIAGSGVGTLTIMKAPNGAKEVSYNVVMRGTDRETVDRAMFEIEEPSAGDSGMGRALRFNTPAIPASEIASGETCVRYDVTMSVPSSVKILKIGSKSVVQVKFADDAELDLKDLSVVLFKLDDKNMIIPSAKVVSDAINYEVFKGWIVGETTVSKSTTVTTQRGTGVTNLKVHQVAPEDPLKPGVSLLRTTTGKGRTDITYIASGVKRPIESIHRASMNGDVYLDYKQARFDGKIAMESKTSTITGASELTAHDKAAGINKNLRAEDDWTHYAGSGEGEDKISVFSRGWTGLYL